jgi:hypothetical protein
LNNAAALLAALLMLSPAAAQKFYPDDPLWREPPPMPVGKLRVRDISDSYDLMQQTVISPGRRPGVTAGAVNTLGEVPDSAWYQNRHSLTRRMSVEELARGPATGTPPANGQSWKIVSAKTTGATPGLILEDSHRQKFLLKFDPGENPSITTAADVVASKFFYALGYNVPENYIVRFGVKQLRLGPDTTFTDTAGRERKMEPGDLDRILQTTKVSRDGSYRAMISSFIGGEIVGPFQYFGTRSDDPNDVVPHENRRDLRGLYVFAAWLNHYDAIAINTLDSVVEENGLRFVKHFLIDFGSTLGASALGPRVLRSGNAYVYDLPFAARQLLTLGLAPRPWQVSRDPYFPELGEFGYSTFDPRVWKPIYPNPAFINALPEDTYWAAKKVMAFTEQDIRAIVRTGEYRDAKASEWLVKTLIARRDKIGAAFLNDVLPLERFRFEHGALQFEDLAVKSGIHAPRRYTVQWFRFDNASGMETMLPHERTFTLPRELASLPPASYFGAAISGAEPRKRVIVYFRTRESGIEVVGIERQY